MDRQAIFSQLPKHKAKIAAACGMCKAPLRWVRKGADGKR
jgi:hypothetical protein